MVLGGICGKTDFWEIVPGGFLKYLAFVKHSGNRPWGYFGFVRFLGNSPWGHFGFALPFRKSSLGIHSDATATPTCAVEISWSGFRWRSHVVARAVKISWNAFRCNATAPRRNFLERYRMARRLDRVRREELPGAASGATRARAVQMSWSGVGWQSPVAACAVNISWNCFQMQH